MASPRNQDDAPGATVQDRITQVMNATWRVIARDGLEGATLRAIARELGVTTGVLTHYFKDKEDLLRFVLVGIFDELAARIAPIAENAPELDRMADVVMRILPIDPGQMDWWKVWLAFTVVALARPDRAAAHAEKYAQQRELWVKAFKRMRSAGHVRDDIDVAIEAETLMAIVDGLGVQAIISPERLTARRQRAIVRAYFAKISAVSS